MKKEINIKQFLALLPILFMGVVLSTSLVSCGDDDGDGGGKTPQEIAANGHEYVDLGLSVKWATCNVGATTPSGYGDYFAWGETTPKSDYSWSTYKYGSGFKALTKYCTNESYGAVDNKTVLELTDDVARANWGGLWRMPTKAEQDELRTECTWEWTTENGINGYKVTGKNGNSIFLPAAGYRDGTSTDDVGSDGSYWSSSLREDSSSSACELDFTSGNVDWDSSDRRYGQSVRAVLPI